jgi:hypothetical protein
MLLVPNMVAPLVQVRGPKGEIYKGTLIPPWNSFFQQFTQAPPPVMALPVVGSPFTYEAKELGTILISGGTLTDVSFTRGSDVTTLGNAARVIPVNVRDIVTITYSVLPIVKFVPTYGNVPQ